MSTQAIKGGWAALLAALIIAGCQADSDDIRVDKPAIPAGYLRRLEIPAGERMLTFGPFVGYYFKPVDVKNLRRLDFICFNERYFYTRDLPANARLFEGQAQWQRLADTGQPLPQNGDRIVPVFFSDAPAAWLQSRPVPQDEYLHFHSAYDARGAVRYGYWLRHVAQHAFTYDMGGRVGPDSPLHHAVRPGPDRHFARIIEFDYGPQ